MRFCLYVRVTRHACRFDFIFSSMESIKLSIGHVIQLLTLDFMQFNIIEFTLLCPYVSTVTKSPVRSALRTLPTQALFYNNINIIIINSIHFEENKFIYLQIQEIFFSIQNQWKNEWAHRLERIMQQIPGMWIIWESWKMKNNNFYYSSSLSIKYLSVIYGMLW